MTSNLGYNPNEVKPITADMLVAHHILCAEDTCYYYDEYPIAASYRDHEGKSRIQNFKIKPVESQAHRMAHKQRAIRHYGKLIGESTSGNAVFFIPAPSSKSKDDPTHDDRLLKTLRYAKENFNQNIEFFEAFETLETRDAFHENNTPRNVADLKRSIACINDELQRIFESGANRVIFFDDMLTTGCTFRACKELFTESLVNSCPTRDIEFFGVFLSRRIPSPPANPFEVFDAEEPF